MASMSRDPSTLPSPGIKTPALDKQAAEITYEGVSEQGSPLAAAGASPSAGIRHPAE